MESKKLSSLKYPIGQFNTPDNITSVQIKEWIISISAFPNTVKSLVDTIDTTQLNWRYRPNGWSIKQLVHHCTDSHLNSLCRFKLALTEDNPTIRPYYEDLWAELPDSLSDDISDALLILKGLHSKWTYLLKSLSEEELKRTFVHPESGDQVTLAENIGIYAWHCDHHIAHIRLAMESGGEYD